MKRAFFWRFISEKLSPDLNRKIEGLFLLSFKNLFLVKLLLDQNHHLLVKFSCKNTCENLDAVKCKTCSMLLAADIAVEQKVIMPAIVIALFIFTRF